MFQVTAVFEDAEVGYGEGEGVAYAVAECLDSIDAFYRPIIDSVSVRIIGDSFAQTIDGCAARIIASIA